MVTVRVEFGSSWQILQEDIGWLSYLEQSIRAQLTINIVDFESVPKIAEDGAKHSPGLCFDEGNVLLMTYAVNGSCLFQTAIRQDHHLHCKPCSVGIKNMRVLNGHVA